jgi:mRNA-degrading endonuclease RelE of RelBE toxin-antitoxin system
VAKGVIFSDQAKADLRIIEQPKALQILKTIARFLESEEGDVKRLQALDPPLFRLRSQNYRVLFRDLGNAIELVRVRDRKDVYR